MGTITCGSVKVRFVSIPARGIPKLNWFDPLPRACTLWSASSLFRKAIGWAGPDPDHARDVFAPSLIDLDRLGRERIVALGKAFADPDERLRDLAARPDLHR